MIAAIRTFLHFLRRRDVKAWRAHRRACMKYLPKHMRKPLQNPPAAA